MYISQKHHFKPTFNYAPTFLFRIIVTPNNISMTTLSITHAILVDRDEQFIAKYPLWLFQQKNEPALNLTIGSKCFFAEGCFMVTLITVENSILKLRCAKMCKTK